MKLDFERIKLLMDIIVECGKHGPLYHEIAGEAQRELADICAKFYKSRQPEAITPPAGPANAMPNPEKPKVPVEPFNKDDDDNLRRI